MREDELEALLDRLKSEWPDLERFIDSLVRGLLEPPPGRLARATRTKARTIAEHERKLDEARSAAAAEPWNRRSTGAVDFLEKEIGRLRREHRVLETALRRILSDEE